MVFIMSNISYIHLQKNFVFYEATALVFKDIKINLIIDLKVITYMQFSSYQNTVCPCLVIWKRNNFSYFIAIFHLPLITEIGNITQLQIRSVLLSYHQSILYSYNRNFILDTISFDCSVGLFDICINSFFILAPSSEDKDKIKCLCVRVREGWMCMWEFCIFKSI